MTEREYIMRLRLPASDNHDASIRRLRAALKRLLRSYQIQCVDLRPVEKPEEEDK